MASNTIPCPLPAADCAKLNKMLENCTEVDCIISVFKELGVDTSEMEAQIAHHRKFAETAKAKFFPNRP